MNTAIVMNYSNKTVECTNVKKKRGRLAMVEGTTETKN